MKTYHNITVKHKRYDYTISQTLESGEVLYHLICEGAGIDQLFDGEDLAKVIQDLPELILDEQKYQEERKGKEAVVRFRIDVSEKKKLDKKAIEKGFKNTSQYLRNLIANA